ncbi:hypothetical protein GAB14E_3074 [Colwellia psychrerythraea]|uniref:Uncharacterized protein n=1 Tax=Colwellia psychrerythraea TaxID=28229 RepID=A0A099KPR1_COLPS|nr:hypothetical protein GAB14E_3074 [Colwellia psychrerythraea]
MGLFERIFAIILQIIAYLVRFKVVSVKSVVFSDTVNQGSAPSIIMFSELIEGIEEYGC